MADAMSRDSPSASRPQDMVLNEMLCYMQYHLKRTVQNNAIEAVSRHFSQDEVNEAKNCLEQTCSVKLKSRRNTPAKMKTGVTIEDIINTLIEVDKNGGETNFVAKNIGRLPKCDPKDIDPYANLQRILTIEERISQIEEQLRSTTHEVGKNSDDMNIVRNTVVVLHEIIQAHGVSDSRVYVPTMEDNTIPKTFRSASDSESETTVVQVDDNDTDQRAMCFERPCIMRQPPESRSSTPGGSTVPSSDQQRVELSEAYEAAWPLPTACSTETSDDLTEWQTVERRKKRRHTPPRLHGEPN